MSFDPQWHQIQKQPIPSHGFHLKNASSSAPFFSHASSSTLVVLASIRLAPLLLLEDVARLPQTLDDRPREARAELAPELVDVGGKLMRGLDGGANGPLAVLASGVLLGHGSLEFGRLGFVGFDRVHDFRCR